MFNKVNKPTEGNKPAPRRHFGPLNPLPRQNSGQVRTGRPVPRSPSIGAGGNAGNFTQQRHFGPSVRPSRLGGSARPQHPAAPARSFERRPIAHKTEARGVETKGVSAEPVVRFVPLGGLEEVGRNCSFFEYKNEIVVIDVGIQFPEEETPGIDYIIPNVSYLEPKKQNIFGIFLTHGHYDHIHALPYVIEKLGNPTIYCAAFTKAMIVKRFEEFQNLPRLKFDVIKHGDVRKISDNFTAEFFNVDHTVPDALGFILDTPAGKMAHFGDFRLTIGKDGQPDNLDIFEAIGKKGIHSIFVDSTNSLREGLSLSEKTVEENLEKLFSQAKGRIIVASFASLITRIVEIFKIAHRMGRKISLNGRSMKDNIQIARDLGYLKVEKDHLISLEELHRYPDNKVMILTTGAQGEPNAGLMRIVSGEHKFVSLKQSDTVIFSSSVVPGNERSVQALQDNISRQVDEVYNTKLLDLHTSGHAYSEDIKLVIKLTKPKFVVPVHAYFFMRKHVKTLAEQAGFPRANVKMMDNGQVAVFTKDDLVVKTDEKINSFYVMVDGLGVGDVEEVVLRDRLNLSQEGMVVIVITLDRTSGKILKNPDIISRGFIFIKENQDILEEMRKRLRGLVGRLPAGQSVEPDYVKGLIRDQIGQFLYNKTRRRPMILPVVIEI